MGIASRALALLWPKGHPHTLAGYGASIVAALGDVLDDLHERARLIVSEASPDTALHTLPEWHAALGIRYDPLVPIETQRARLAAMYYSIGGATLNDIERQIRKELPGITITEISATSETGEAECGVEVCGAESGDYASGMYEVSGTLTDDAEVARLVAILQHFAPLHLAPYSSLTILSDSGSSETGVAVCGIEECGA